MANLRDNSERSKWAIYTLLTVLFFEFLLIISNGGEIITIYEYQETYNQDILENNDLRQQVITYFFLASLVINIVFFLRWFRRAYYNLHQVSINKLKFDESAATSAWFIPIVNLSRPFSVMKDMWDNVKHVVEVNAEVIPKYDFVTSNLRLWWGLWIASNISGQVAAKVGNGDMDSFIIGDYIAIGSSVLSIASGLLLYNMIKTYSLLEPLIGIKNNFDAFGTTKEDENWESPIND